MEWYEPPKTRKGRARRPFLRSGEFALGGDLLGRRNLLGLVILDRGLERFLGQNGTMNLHRGETAEGVDHFLVGEILGFRAVPALDQLGRNAGGGEGAAAAEGLEAGVLDLAVADLQGDFHDVAAGRR